MIKMGALGQITASIRAETEAGRLYIKNCEKFGLDPELLGRKCEYRNNIYTVEGLYKRGRLYFIYLKNDRYEMPIDISVLKDPKKVKLL